VRYAACLFVMMAALAISIPLSAQEVSHPDTLGFARFSYIGSPVWGGIGSQSICFAVSSDGDYRFVRLGKSGMQGKMSEEDFKKFKALIEAEDFRSLRGDFSGLIHKDSDSFAAEIPWLAWEGHGRTQRIHWLNADGLRPFPVSVGKLIDWMQNFNAKGSRSLDYADYPDVCPSGGLRYVQPSIAQR
jgi:hypothetical protein